GPLGQHPDRADESTAELGELVFDLRRGPGVGLPGYQAAVLQPAQRVGEHLVGDPADQPGQLTVPPRLVGEAVEDHHGPLGRPPPAPRAPGSTTCPGRYRPMMPPRTCSGSPHSRRAPASPTANWSNIGRSSRSPASRAISTVRAYGPAMEMARASAATVP